MRSSAVSGILALALVTYVTAQASPCASGGSACTTGQTCFLVSLLSANAGLYSCLNAPCGQAGACDLASQYCDSTATPAVCRSNTGAPAAVSGGSASGGSSLTGGFIPGLPSFGTGGFGSTCTANSDCTQQGFTCVGGFCLPGPNADCPSACSTGFSCTYGVCVPNVNAPCDPACASGTQCLYGQCIPAGPTCSPTCATGYVCAGQQFGCIPTAAAPCSPACTNGFTCAAGVCVPPAPSCSGTCTPPQYCGPDVAAYTGVNPFSAAAGATLTWKCLSPPGSATSATCSPACNAGTQICAMGTCVAKPAFAVGTGTGAVAQAVVDAMLCGSLNLALLPAPSAAPMSGQTASFGGAAFAQIDASASVTWPALTFSGSAAAAASMQSALTVGASAQVQAATFLASLPNVACIVNSAARMAIAAATVAVNSTVTWSFAAAADASAAGGVVTLGSLDLSGSIIVTGSGRFEFPQNPGLVTVARGAGVVQFSGGATLSGNAATAAVQVSGGASGSATVYVSAAQAFTTAGNLLGASGSVQVNGEFAFAGASIQPAVYVNSAGHWTINGTACATGEVHIAAGGAVSIRADGRGVRMGVIRSCEANAQITYYASGTFAAGTASSGTIAFYAAGTSTSAFACGVRVIDESGAVADLTVASNPRTSAWGGNIFTASQGSATFGAQSLTYTGAQGNGAAATAPATLALAAALVIAAAGRYLM